MSKVKYWIDASAKVYAARERAAATRARKAYRTEPYKSAAEVIAEAHERCAEIWEWVVKNGDIGSPVTVGKPPGDCPKCGVPLKALPSDCACLDARCPTCGGDWCIAECETHSYKNLEVSR